MAAREDERHSLVVDVVDALADAEGVDPTKIDYVLNDYIDTDAIEALATKSDTDWTLEFSVHDRTVMVDDTGLITVDGTEYR